MATDFPLVSKSLLGSAVVLSCTKLKLWSEQICNDDYGFGDIKEKNL